MLTERRLSVRCFMLLRHVTMSIISTHIGYNYRMSNICGYWSWADDGADNHGSPKGYSSVVSELCWYFGLIILRLILALILAYLHCG